MIRLARLAGGVGQCRSQSHTPPATPYKGPFRGEETLVESLSAVPAGSVGKLVTISCIMRLGGSNVRQSGISAFD
jgi:hypothetical protein